MSINRVVLTGNLTREPDIRRTQGGMTIMTLGLAVNERRKNNSTGEWEDQANFVDCTMFGNRAEAVSKYLSKGKKVAVDGKLRYSSWTDKGGNKRSKLEVVIDDLELLGQKDSGNAAQSTPKVQHAEATVYDDDCPF